MIVLGLAVACWVYAYIGYPVLLAAGRRQRRPAPDAPARWPALSITVPVYNGADVIAGALDAILASDYPGPPPQIIVISDASTDASDAIAARYASRGVELLRLPRRCGKTAAENAAAARVRGEIVINTDAAVRVHPEALRRLAAALADPTVGVASGRDVSVGSAATRANAGETGYVGYEMWVRDLESRGAGIVGASGCLYAIRAELHRRQVPDRLSRDFAAALVAREAGLRAISVPDAICYVPRSGSLRHEYARKVRTMARGLATLWAFRRLLDPRRDPAFAWRLVSHKLCRWLTPWAALAAVAALAVAARTEPAARGAFAAIALGTGLALAGWLWPGRGSVPRLFSLPAFACGAVIAGLHAWIEALRGGARSTWDPTRRVSPAER
ncbi:MAG TPA: glycosyltransferase [Gemmatimonadales bacterium]